MERAARPIKFVEFEGGCWIPLSHKLNQDGYFRKMWNNKEEGWLRVMMHRAIWEIRNGPIPEGYEVDHVCRCRACCNPDHLQILDRTTHLVKTNKERYKFRNDKAKEDWKEGMDATGIAEKYEVNRQTALKWIRNWKSDTNI